MEKRHKPHVWRVKKIKNIDQYLISIGTFSTYCTYIMYCKAIDTFILKFLNALHVYLGIQSIPIVYKVN